MPGGGLISGLLGSALDGLMRDIWTGTLALLRAVLGLVGELGSIDITPGGGAISNELWTTMLQLAGIIAMILFFAQLAATALNPRKNFLTAATGPVQYGVALALSIALVAGLLGAADGLASLILTQGANVTDTAAAMDQLGLVDDNNAVKATVLGILGIIGVLPLAIGYGITLIFRSASILVLVATIPITAAGLTNLATKHWFWRVSRWLLALIFLKPAFALCFALGAGVVAASGRTAGPTPLPPGAAAVAPADGTGVVTLLLGLGIMFVALFAPFALFRLFAFIEPGTQPHQAMMSAFSSAMAGARSTVGGIAGADVGSVFSGATGGRFGGDGSGGLPGLGSGMGGDKEQAAAAGLAVATGGASAAAGAAGAGAGAGAGEAGAAGAGRGLVGAGAGGSSNAAKSDGDGGQEGERAEELAGAGAAASAGPGAVAGGASGASGGGSGGGASGGGAGGGGWSIAGAAAGAASSVGAMGGGRVGAAAAALGGAAGGIGGAAVGIGGSAPMRAAPMGGAAGSVGSGAVSDYGDGYLHRGASPQPASGSSPSSGYSGSYYPPPPPVPVPSYRDESFDAPEDGPDDGARGGVTGVL